MNPQERPTAADLAALVQGPDGPVCLQCGCRDFRVSNRWKKRDGTVRRLKRCRHCGQPIHTSEVED